MTVLRVDRDRFWLPRPHTCTVKLTSDPPPNELLTSVHLFGFQGNELLMVLLERGWDIPGGHIEPGESPNAAMLREAREEAGVELADPQLFAVNEIMLECARPEDWRYPYPLSYQLFFRANVRVGPFQSTTEVDERAFFTPGSAREVPWVIENRELYEAARPEL